MNALKFAFETTVVGLLALPWLILMTGMFWPLNIKSHKASDMPLRLLDNDATTLGANQLLSKLFDPTVLSVMTVVLAYLIGSAAAPLATQLLDDSDLPGVKIRQVRADLYLSYLNWFRHSTLSSDSGSIRFATDQLCRCQEPIAAIEESTDASVDNIQNLRATDTASIKQKAHMEAVEANHKCWDLADQLFLLQEQAVLKEDADKTERLDRLHDQVMVLRGAVFNGFVFTVLSLFCYCSRQRGESIIRIWERPTRIIQTVTALATAGSLLYIAWYCGKPDFLQHDVSDPPIMESGLLFLGSIGVFVLLRGVTKAPYAPLLVGGFIFTVLVYGGWLWAEVIYTSSVIGAFVS